MNTQRRVRRLLGAAAATLALPTISNGAVYQVEPVIISEGFSIDGGFIETDGTLGPLAASNILDYEFRTSIPGYPYVFTPDTPRASLTAGAIEATAAEILLPVDTEPGPPINLLSVADFEDPFPLCQTCAYRVDYINFFADPPLTPDWTIIRVGIFDSEGVFSVLDALQLEPPQAVTIARAPIPGDHNLDGMVNAADYATWRDGAGLDHSINGFLIWQQNFSAGQATVGQSAAIPELGSAALALIGAALLMTRRRTA